MVRSAGSRHHRRSKLYGAEVDWSLKSGRESGRAIYYVRGTSEADAKHEAAQVHKSYYPGERVKHVKLYPIAEGDYSRGGI